MPVTSQGCRPISVTYQPASVATQPENVNAANVHSSQLGGDALFRIRHAPYHDKAIIKARRKGDDWLADRVYSSVPAASFGARQLIEISPVSGLSNVSYNFV